MSLEALFVKRDYPVRDRLKNVVVYKIFKGFFSTSKTNLKVRKYVFLYFEKNPVLFLEKLKHKVYFFQKTLGIFFFSTLLSVFSCNKYLLITIYNNETLINGEFENF